MTQETFYHLQGAEAADQGINLGTGETCFILSDRAWAVPAWDTAGLCMFLEVQLAASRSPNILGLWKSEFLRPYKSSGVLGNFRGPSGHGL